MIWGSTGVVASGHAIFDCPNPGAVTGFLRAELAADTAALPPVIADLNQRFARTISGDCEPSCRNCLMTTRPPLSRDWHQCRKEVIKREL